MTKILSTALIALAAIAGATTARADVRITEFMYQGANSGNREFFELTNISSTAVDINGWSYNDNNPNNPVSFGNFFGTLAANESIVLTEMTPDAFRTYWGLASTVRVFSIGGNSNLGSDDTINIYSSATQNAGTLVDSVTYSGTTRGISRNRPEGVTGQVVNAQFLNASVGDAYGSAFAPTSPADLGNPGRYPFTATAAVPEPATWAMMIGGFALIGAAARRKRTVSFA
ncbi:lamin tail domain-containing protein [Sphingobium nicotianae]|uniref:PEP-CTERM sorting domain-containing protein n=1 Tax=Sphingobium nicotianae TaxID=2782607 RepID=A0A9X1DG14_9SPHN|nr:lamin tail domain-containing protein [Sphingobium nicotianae]MBT2189356.1 PEP-CTERM sorting domain-containing protein [Sphingobium nicotianae]